MPDNETSEAFNDTVKRIYRNIETLKALDYGCCLRAMRELLDDPSWAPEEIVDIIVTHNGFPSDKMILLEKHAPVMVIQKGQIRTSGGERGATVLAEDKLPIILQRSDRVVISYTTDAETRKAHMECVNIGDIDKECLALVVKKVPSGD